MKPFNYTVAVMNEGQEGIWLMPFRLADDPNTTVLVGEVLPAGRKSISPYYCRPAHKLEIGWRYLQTGEERRGQVVMQLPDAFTKYRGSAIVFHIKPEEGTVAVSYEILDPKTGRISVIRQSTETFP